MQLIKLNINTGEFNAGFVKGIFLNNKVEVTANRKWIDQELITIAQAHSFVKT